MTPRSLFAICIALTTVSTTVRAEPISVNFQGTDFFLSSQFTGSRFEGNPTVGQRTVDTNGFQGNVFGWLAIMRFQSPGDFALNGETANEVLSARDFSFVASVRDAVGRVADITFRAVASGVMNFTNPRLDVNLLDTMGHATLGDTTVDVTLSTVQHPFVNPAITFDGGVSIDGPLPIVTDIMATIAVTAPPPDDDGDGGGSTDPGGNPGVPEPTAIALGVVGLALAGLRRKFIQGA